MQALLKGAIDFSSIPTAALYEAVDGQQNISTAVDGAEFFYQMSFNLSDDPKSTANPAVLDPAFRRAIAYAIDKATLVERIARGYGTPGTTPVVPLHEFWHWEPPPDEAITFDIAQANELLDEAGYLDTDGDGMRQLPGERRAAGAAAVHARRPTRTASRPRRSSRGGWASSASTSRCAR